MVSLVFVGVYLPLLWEQSFCWKSPIALGYTRGHFSALVAMENDGYGNRGAGANLNTDDDVTITFLPLVDSERKLLHIHFLSAQEVRYSKQFRLAKTLSLQKNAFEVNPSAGLKSVCAIVKPLEGEYTLNELALTTLR